MHANTRACVAFIVASIVNKKEYLSVFDHAFGKRIMLSGGVLGPMIALYDHDRGCHVNGSTQRIFDEGRDSHISLEISGTYFVGVDESDTMSFSGYVHGDQVTVYDEKESAEFSYSL